MIEIKISTYFDFKNNIQTKNLKHFNFSIGERFKLIAVDGPIYFTHTLTSRNLDDYQETLQATANQKVGDEVVVSAFANKKGHSFKGRGLKENCPAGQETEIYFVIPDGEIYDMDGIEVLNGAFGDTIQMKVMDNEGAYTGQVGFVLDQFGINWNAKPDMVKQLPYNATVLQKMKVALFYKNNGNEAREVYVNLDLHKVVS